MGSKCENFTNNEGHSQLASWWIDGFIQDIVTGIGVIGNTMICVILLQKSVRRNTFNQLRVALAFFDIFLLIAMCFTFFLLRSAKDILQAVHPKLLWPFMNISISISIFITVVIAWERYEAINNPYTYKSYHEYRAMKYVTSIIVAVLMLNIGKFFEIQPTPCVERPGFMGVLTLGPIYKNQFYAIYNTVVLRILIGGLIPVTLLICLYTKIFLKIKEHKLTIASQIVTVKKNIKKEERLAITFAGVVITLIICNIPGWLLVIKALIDGGKANDLEYYETANVVRMVFYMLNSALNIFIYLCLDTTFRRELKKFFLCQLRAHVNIRNQGNAPNSTECETAC